MTELAGKREAPPCYGCRSKRKGPLGHRMLRLLAALFAAGLSLFAQSVKPSEQSMTIRGQRQDLYCYRSSSSPANGKAIFLPGDGGWRGFALEIAENIASWGYDICGMDTKRYLESFTSGKKALTEADVAADMRSAATWMAGQSREKVIYIGWSEGANMGALAGAAPENRAVFKGVVMVGISETGILGWRWQDNVTYVTKKKPDEPQYPTATYLPRIAPLPLLMIHSSHDEYTSVDRARKLFESAGNPKRFRVVESENHRFEGNQADFFRGLKEGLEWVRQTAL